LPLLNHLAAQGWVGFNVNYRLSPVATFPDHLVDIKRALAWIRAHAEDYGIDPNFIVVTGGSAGGHLTALMGLTCNDPLYQPEFEQADTSIQVAVPFYGVYDFTDHLNLMPSTFRKRLLEPWVMKAFFADEPEKFEKASPLFQVHRDAPPFLIIHGDRDTLAPVEYAREFAKKLKACSQKPVLYAELAGAQHAFDVFTSPRTIRVLMGVERFVTKLYRNYLAELANQSPNPRKVASLPEGLSVSTKPAPTPEPALVPTSTPSDRKVGHAEPTI
jgi:acetyl esterase/lipase